MATNDPLGLKTVSALPPATPPASSGTSDYTDLEGQEKQRLSQFQSGARAIDAQTAADRNALTQAENDFSSLSKQTAAREAQVQDTMERELRINYQKLFAPPKEDLYYKASAFKKFLPIAVAFAGIAAVASGNIAIGINSMAEGLKGFKDGNDEEYAKKYQEWKQASSDALAEDGARIRAYQDWERDVLASDQQNLSSQLEVLRSLASNFRDDHMLQMANSSNLNAVSTAVRTSAEVHSKASKAVADASHALKPPQVTKSIEQAVGALFHNDPRMPPYSAQDAKQQQLLLYISNRAAALQQQDPKLTPYAAAMQAYKDAETNGVYTTVEAEKDND